MNIEEMKKFAAMTDEEREMEIYKAEWKIEADEDYQISTLAHIFRNGSLPACCEEPLFGVKDQENLVICFNMYGEIVSDVFHNVSVYETTCTNCGSKVKTPQSHIDNWVKELKDNMVVE
jgi:hypothetical protein